MRPLPHYTPRRGWINDPNGLIQLDGVHHLYYQTNPEDTRFQSMHWGHATSTDLAHWTEQPVALVPGDPNTDYDRRGWWSGVSVLVDARLALFYTGVGDDGLSHRAWPGRPTLPGPASRRTRPTRSSRVGPPPMRCWHFGTTPFPALPPAGAS